MPYWQWLASGWNCTPQIRISSFTNAAGMLLSERATALKPVGGSVTESPWLIHEMKDWLGTLPKSAVRPVRVTRARPNSFRPSDSTFPPRSALMRCRP